LVKTFTETGTEIDYWHEWVVFCAHWALYVGIARTIIFFLCGQEAVKGTAEAICKLVAMALVYFFIIMLCVAEWQIHSFKLKSEEFESENTLLVYTLNKM